MNEGVVTVNDVRTMGYCSSGIRQRLTDLGLDYRKFITHGLPIDELEVINDADVARCVAAAKARGSHG